MKLITLYEFLMHKQLCGLILHTELSMSEADCAQGKKSGYFNALFPYLCEQCLHVRLQGFFLLFFICFNTIFTNKVHTFKTMITLVTLLNLL